MDWELGGLLALAKLLYISGIITETRHLEM